MLSFIDTIFKHLSIWVIKLYQLILSPDKGFPRFWLKGKICRHRPHCSQYALEHITQYWFFWSIIPIMDRISSCTPWYELIHDPVPPITQKAKNNHFYKIKTKSTKPLRIVFFSSAHIGVSFLKNLINDKRFNLVGIVTQPDQPSWRGMSIKPNIIKQYVSDHRNLLNIQDKQLSNFCQTPYTFKLHSKQHPWVWVQFQKRLTWCKPDYIVVIAYGKIIPRYILDIPHIAPINIHGSLLPKYRWASPIQTCLLNGDKQTWITIMHMSAGLDEWDSIDQLVIDLDYTTTTKDLISKFEHQWPAFLNKTLIDYATWTMQLYPQDHTLATITWKIDKQDGYCDILNEPLGLILRKYNAYFLRPKIWFTYDNKRIIIEQLIINRDNWKTKESAPLADSNYILNSSITHCVIKPEGKWSMSREERTRWYRK